MRVLGPAAIIITMATSNVDAACKRRAARSHSAWATILVRSADVILDAEVVRREDASAGQSAALRPLVLYKGWPATTYTMSLPRSDGIIVTEAYAGFSAKQGDHRFLILHKNGGEFQTSPCEEYLVENADIKSTVIGATRRD